MHCQLFPFAQIDQVQRGLIQSGIAERLTATIYSGVTLPLALASAGIVTMTLPAIIKAREIAKLQSDFLCTNFFILVF